MLFVCSYMLTIVPTRSFRILIPDLKKIPCMIILTSFLYLNFVLILAVSWNFLSFGMPCNFWSKVGHDGLGKGNCSKWPFSDVVVMCGGGGAFYSLWLGLSLFVSLGPWTVTFTGTSHPFPLLHGRWNRKASGDWSWVFLLSFVKGYRDQYPSPHLLGCSDIQNSSAMWQSFPWDFPSRPVDKNLPANAGDMGSIPGPERFHILWGN